MFIIFVNTESFSYYFVGNEFSFLSYIYFFLSHIFLQFHNHLYESFLAIDFAIIMYPKSQRFYASVLLSQVVILRNSRHWDAFY